MPSKQLNSLDVEDYREQIQALEFDGKQIENLTQQTIEKIDEMLDDDLFNQTNLNIIQSLARESVVNVPTLIDNKVDHDDNDCSQESHVVIKSNERIEMLIEYVKHESFVFMENAEKIRVLIDLNMIHQNTISYDVQCLWKNELVQMQGNISSNQMKILLYYRNRSEIGTRLLKQPCISDYWEHLIEMDEDCFFHLRMILYNLRLFYLRLYDMLNCWIDSSSYLKDSSHI